MTFCRVVVMTTVSQLLTVGVVVTVVSGVDVVTSGLEFFCLLTLPDSAVSPLARFRWGNFWKQSSGQCRVLFLFTHSGTVQLPIGALPLLQAPV